MTNVEIRKIREEEFTTVSDFLENNGVYNGDFEEHQSNFLLAIFGGDPIGCISHKEHDGVVELRSGAVKEELRRKHIETKLFKTKMKELEENGVETIYARTEKRNVASNGLLQSLCFSLITGNEKYVVSPRCGECQEDYYRMGYCRTYSPDKKCPFNFYKKRLKQP